MTPTKQLPTICDFCPKCRAIKSLQMSLSIKTKKDKKGKEKHILIRSYHCESCNSFVKSEEAVAAAD